MTQPPFLKRGQQVPVYTTLAVLRKIRKEVGLEAMLEAQETFLGKLDREEPKLRQAVQSLLGPLDAECIYKGWIESRC